MHCCLYECFDNTFDGIKSINLLNKFSINYDTIKMKYLKFRFLNVLNGYFIDNLLINQL